MFHSAPRKHRFNGHGGRFLAFAAATALVSGFAKAQRSTLTAIGPDHDRHAVVHYDVDPSGTHWARGRSYKASANGDGFTYVPFLGSDAPRSFPVKFALLGASRQGASILVEPVGEVERSADRLVIDRGGVKVRYDMTPERVEQSFALDAPEGTGDLTLHLSINTELQAQTEGSGLRFSSGLGGVNYTEAFALDAAGRKAKVVTTLVDGELRLTVPAGFLEVAAGPIVVDPFLFTFSSGPLTADLTLPDAVENPAGTGVSFFAIAQERFSATDLDVYSWVVTAGGAVLDGAYVEQSTVSWIRPRVAQLRTNGVSLVVAEADSVAFPGSRDVVARARRFDGTLEPPFVLKSATASYSCEQPDVGADSVSQGFAFCIPYSRNYGSYRDVYCLISGSTPGPFGEFALASSGGHDESSPAVSKQTGRGPGLDFMVAWTSRDLATAESTISGRYIRYNGSLGVGPFLVAPAVPQRLYFDLDVSNGVDGRFIVTYDDRPSDVTDAFVTLISGGAVRNTIELQLDEHADRSPNQNRLVVATGVDHYFLGYEENGQLYMTVLEVIDSNSASSHLAILERRRTVPGAILAPGSLTALERVADSNSDSRAMFLWAQPTATSSEIVGTYAELPLVDNQAASWQFCYGEANSTGDRGFIHVLGNRGRTAPHTIRVEALPPMVFGFALASLNQDFAPGAGGSQGTLCLGGLIGRFDIFHADAQGVATYSLDPTQIPQPMGTVSAITGQQWAFQAWHRDAIMGTATSNFTNGALLQFR